MCITKLAKVPVECFAKCVNKSVVPKDQIRSTLNVTILYTTHLTSEYVTLLHTYMYTILSHGTAIFNKSDASISILW